MADVQHPAEVQRYFAAKARDYDAVDDQLYWRLSDALLWRLIESHPARLADGLLLDAGGGTARWSVRLARRAPFAAVVVLDLTGEMLREARRKAARCPVPLLAVQADLDGPLPFRTDGQARFAAALCLNNVIGFVADPPGVLRRVAGQLRRHGRLWLTAPSLWHMAYFYCCTGRSDELAGLLASRRGRFTREMPEIRVFTPEEIRAICESAGYLVERVLGFPSLIYPGIGDTGLAGDDRQTMDRLASAADFGHILQAELSALDAGAEQIASRGANLFVAASKL